jgi:hypothetical protein
VHAERLNAIAREIVEAFDRHEILPAFDDVLSAIGERLGNPGDRSLDERISAMTRTLFERLDRLELRNFPPTWRKIMTELGLGDLEPDVIRTAIENAFNTRLVDSDFEQALQKIRSSVASKLENIRKMRAGLEAVGIGVDDLDGGKVEFDVAMPRESIDDSLGGFNKELATLNRQLLVLASVAIDSSATLRINSIATNDFSVALNINVDLGEIVAFILVALSAMRIGYRSKLDVIKNSALKDLPEPIREQIDIWARGYIKEEIAKIVSRLPDECPQSVDREKLESNKGPVGAALEYIEAKQERGFNMDVRVGALEAPREAAPDEDVEKREQIERLRARLAAIAKRSAELKVLERQSHPILEIEHSEDGEK